MGDELCAELAELKSLLGDDYQSLCAQGEQQHAIPKRAPQRAPKKKKKENKQNATASNVQHNAVAQQLKPQVPFLERIRIAQKENEALTSSLRAHLAQVERQLIGSDHAATAIRQAQAIDRNLGRQVGGAQQFSWTVRHSEAARGCNSLLAATGAPAPPQSTFWAHAGKAPAPNEDAKALTKLFWRNPAAAKPPRAWQEVEEGALRNAVRSISITQQRSALAKQFRAQVSAGADPAALKGQLAQQLEALGSNGGSHEMGYSGSTSGLAALEDAANFSVMDWQGVAQQVGDRSADECAVHFLSHVLPELEGKRDYALSPEQQQALLDAVAVHGRHCWPLVGAALGLPWKPWRLLEAFWKAAAAADAPQRAEEAASQAAAGALVAASGGHCGDKRCGKRSQTQQDAAVATLATVGQSEAQCLCDESPLDSNQENSGANGAVNNGWGINRRALETQVVVPEVDFTLAPLAGIVPLGVGAEDVAVGVEVQDSGGSGMGTSSAAGIKARRRYWEWPEVLDEKLLKVVEDLLKSPWAPGDHVSWMHVAFMVREGVTAEQCKNRCWQLQHIQRLAGAFTEQESQYVVAAVREYGQDWSKVARVVPGRTPRQCSEHFMFATSRPAQDVAHLWTPELRRQLFQLRVQHCRGPRQVHWPAIVTALSELCGTRLSVEDVRKKSRALVKQLASHGMPIGYSIAQQLEYLKRFPDAFQTRRDSFRATLHAWGQENGINIRPSVTSTPSAAPASSAPAATIGTEIATAGPSGSEVTNRVRVGRMSELLQQTQYLRFLDEAEPPQAEEPEAEMPAADDAEDSVQECSKGQPQRGRAAEMLKGASAEKHPAAAALHAFLLRAGPLTASVAGAADRAQQGGEPTSAEMAALAATDVSADQAAQPNTVGGVTECDVHATAPSTAPAEAAAGTTGGVQDAPQQGDGAADALPAQHGSFVAGLLAEGRWIQDVKVNPAQRRARIAALQSAKRLTVCVQMPQLREKLKAAKSIKGHVAVPRSARKSKRSIDDSISPPPDTEKRKAACSAEEDEPEDGGSTPQGGMKKRRKIKRKSRKTCETAQERMPDVQRACVGEESTRAEAGAAQVGSGEDTKATRAEAVSHAQTACQAAEVVGGAVTGGYQEQHCSASVDAGVRENDGPGLHGASVAKVVLKGQRGKKRAEQESALQ